MSKPGKKYGMHEIAETRAAGQAAAFDEMIEKIRERGATITRDETSALYTEVGMQEFEVGHERIVEFNLNHFDFQLKRDTETHSLQGSGHMKHIEELEAPRSRITMRRKAETAQDWQVMDIDDLF